MTTRKPTPSLLYTNSRSKGWVRTLASFIDEGMAALCRQQWQRAPIPVAYKLDTQARARRPR
jgi:hypothetical protein